MKKLIIVITVFVGFLLNAQEKTAFEKDTYQLVETLTKPAFEPVIVQFTSMVKADKVNAFKKELNESFPELYTAMANIYMKEYTHEEIKKLLEFYETDLGKKVAKNSATLAQKGMAAGQAWGMKVQSIMSKYQ